jgi:Domain of unknown function (DUF4129)
VSPAQAREEARHILAERRFHGTSVPRPLHGFFSWLARHLHFIVRAWDWLAVRFGGAYVLWAILGAIVLLVAAALVARLAQRRTEVEAHALGRRGRGWSEDPAELERLADEAERRGDLEIALRLRFRAGLLRLDARGAIEFRPSISTYEVRRALRSVDFDVLAFDFDEVVYGGRPAGPADLESARRRWPEVVEHAGRREAAA